MHGVINMGGIVIDVENVTKIYPNGVVANRGVSLRVCSGEIVCLVGLTVLARLRLFVR